MYVFNGPESYFGIKYLLNHNNY